MAVALQSPWLIGALVSVDNAPVDAHLKTEFYQYVQGLREVEDAGVKRQVDADGILQKYTTVGKSMHGETMINAHVRRHYQYDNSSSPILFYRLKEIIFICAFLLRHSLQVLTRWAIFPSRTRMSTAMTDQP